MGSYAAPPIPAMAAHDQDRFAQRTLPLWWAMLQYPAQTISTLCALGVLLTLLPAQGSPLVSYEAQRRFVERAWPGQVRVEIAEDSLITQGGAPTHARSVRAFLQVGAKGNALLAVPTQALQGAKQVTIVGSDGSRCAQPLVGMKALIESPLTLLPSCLPRVYDSGALKGPSGRSWPCRYGCLSVRLHWSRCPPDPVAVRPYGAAPTAHALLDDRPARRD